MSLVTCHLSHVTLLMSHVTCHISLPPVTNANCHRPLPADSPIIQSRLVPQKTHRINHGQKTLLKLLYLFHQLFNFDVLLDLKSLKPYKTTLFSE